MIRVMRCSLIVLPLALIASPAAAQEREFCADRPGLGTPACTMEPGRVMAELGVAAWDHSRSSASIEDHLTYGNLLVRIGLDQLTEIEVGVTGYNTVRSLDRSSGTIAQARGIGDTTIALRRSLSGPDGPIAVHGFVTLPTGANAISAGDWGASVLVPMGLKVGHGLELDLTPEIDAAVNASGTGRHLRWGGVVGLSHALVSNVTLEGEVGTWRDNDPAGHATDARAALSLAWQAGKSWQLDLEGDAGLTSAAPRRSLLVGLARRF